MNKNEKIGQKTVGTKPAIQPNHSPHYQVVTYQIPVPLGDCSAHFLIKDGAIESAILMDGGVDSDHVLADDQIEKALAFIDKKQQNDKWQFSAWVVTHWDSDHFLGVINFFSKNGNFIRRKNKISYFKSDAVLLCGGDPSDLELTVKGATKDLDTYITDTMGLKFNSLSWGHKLIGRDLFKNKIVLEWGTGKFENQYLKAAPLECPVFCVLAANGYGINSLKPYIAKPTPNQTSILSVLIWPNSKRYSYYTGGDGSPKVALESVIPFLEGQSVTVLKLDHHGSSGELLGTGKTRVTEDIVTEMQPDKVIVTPGNGYGHPSWDVVAFLYDHYRKLRQPSQTSVLGCLYTTRSPYWAQAARLTGMDVNLSKIKKIWAILSRWEKSQEDDIVQSWDKWKESTAKRGLKNEHLQDPDWIPDSSIVEAAIYAEESDTIGDSAEEALFQDFKEKFIKLAKERPDEAFLNMKKRPSGRGKEMFTSQQWRQLFGKWKWAQIKEYRNALGVALAKNKDVPDLSSDKSSLHSKSIEAMIDRQQERSAWADTMRHLWNLLSIQPVNADTDQGQYFILRLTSEDSSVTDGTIEVYTDDGEVPEALETNLHGAVTRSYAKAMGYTNSDFAMQELPKEEQKNFETYIILHKEEKVLERQIRSLQMELNIKDLEDADEVELVKEKFGQIKGNEKKRASLAKVTSLENLIVELRKLRKEMYRK